MSRYENNAQCFFFYSLCILASIVTIIGLDGIGDYVIYYHRTRPESLWKYVTLKKDLSLLVMGTVFHGCILHLTQRNLSNNSFTLENVFRKWILYAWISLIVMILFYGLTKLFYSFLDNDFNLLKVISYGWLLLIVTLYLIYNLIEVAKSRIRLSLHQKVIICIFASLNCAMSFYGLKLNVDNTQSKEFNKLLKEDKEKAKQSSMTKNGEIAD